jgi:drug/metabolite transporter (DMT)-like permease
MSHNKAVAIILLGGSFMSLVGLVMRLMETDDGMVILFYRSISLSAMVMTVACLRRRESPLTFLGKLDKTDVAMGAALSIAFTTYVFAMLMTSVASTLFILTTAPFMAALIGWVWINERPHPFTWIAMVAALIGVGLMISDGFELGRTQGNIVALLSAFFFAVMLVLARRSKKDDVLGGTFLGGIMALGLAGISAIGFGDGLDIAGYDLTLALFMGAFTIGIGIALVTSGAPYVPAAEVSLLVLIESVLGPLWPWLFLGEDMSMLEIIGGVTVMAAVAGLAMLGTKKPRLAAQQQ